MDNANGYSVLKRHTIQKGSKSLEDLTGKEQKVTYNSLKTVFLGEHTDKINSTFIEHSYLRQINKKIFSGSLIPIMISGVFCIVFQILHNCMQQNVYHIVFSVKYNILRGFLIFSSVLPYFIYKRIMYGDIFYDSIVKRKIVMTCVYVISSLLFILPLLGNWARFLFYLDRSEKPTIIFNTIPILLCSYCCVIGIFQGIVLLVGRIGVINYLNLSNRNNACGLQGKKQSQEEDIASACGDGLYRENMFRSVKVRDVKSIFSRFLFHFWHLIGYLLIVFVIIYWALNTCILSLVNSFFNVKEHEDFGFGIVVGQMGLFVELYILSIFLVLIWNVESLLIECHIIFRKNDIRGLKDNFKYILHLLLETKKRHVKRSIISGILYEVRINPDQRKMVFNDIDTDKTSWFFIKEFILIELNSFIDDLEKSMSLIKKMNENNSRMRKDLHGTNHVFIKDNESSGFLSRIFKSIIRSALSDHRSVEKHSAKKEKNSNVKVPTILIPSSNKLFVEDSLKKDLHFDGDVTKNDMYLLDDVFLKYLWKFLTKSYLGRRFMFFSFNIYIKNIIEEHEANVAICIEIIHILITNSLHEDMYGQVQQDLKGIVENLLRVYCFLKKAKHSSVISRSNAKIIDILENAVIYFFLSINKTFENYLLRIDLNRSDRIHLLEVLNNRNFQ